MEFVYIRNLKIFGLEKYYTHVRVVRSVHEDFNVPTRPNFYLSIFKSLYCHFGPNIQSVPYHIMIISKFKTKINP